MERLPTHLQSRKERIPSETLISGKEIFQRMLSMFNEAQHSIDLQFYTFEADATGRKVLEALRLAKERNPNLQIRLLVDNSISFRHDGSTVLASKEARKKRNVTYELLNKMKEEGILEDVKVTNWFPHNMILNPLKLYSNVLHRDHKKLICIDTRDLQNHPDARPMAMVTSANVAWYHEHQRKELGRVYHGTDGPVPFLASDYEYTFNNAKKWERVYAVRSVGEYFQKYGFRRGFWKHVGWDFIGSIARNPQKPGERLVFQPGPRGHDSAVVTDSFYGELPLIGKKIGAREATDEAFSMLDLAQKGDSVIIFSPYPGIFSLTKHLLNAGKRGVDVHLVISQNYEEEIINPKNTQGILGKFVHSFYAGWPKKLAASGVVLHEYLGEKENLHGILHAKGAVWVRSDGTARTLIGSTNFSKGPISGMNREIAVVEETKATDPLVTYAKDLIADSNIITTRTYSRRQNSVIKK